MARRYHQSRRDRMDERRGMEHHIERNIEREHDEMEHNMERQERKDYPRGHDMYSGMHDRRRREMEDAGMIHEDHHAIANMPQEVMIKPYPSSYSYLPEDLDDTISGVDRQINLDDSKRRENFMPKKV